MADTQVRPEVQTWMDTIHGGDIELYKVVADRLTHLGVATDPAVQKAIGAALRQWYADQMQQRRHTSSYREIGKARNAARNTAHSRRARSKPWAHGG
jgi:hypothetical protein